MTCGLCGNYDRRADNDLSLAPFEDGQATSPISLGNRMVAPYVAGCPLVPEESLDPVSRLLAQSPSAHARMRSTCNMLKGNLFKACRDVVDSEKYIDRCQKTLSQCILDGNAQCEPCQVFASYSRKCYSSREKVVLSWRSKDLCCKYELILTKHFQKTS